MKDYMDIRSPRGTKVRFSFPENGYKGDQDWAKRFLTVGNIYTVHFVDVSGWSSEVFLAEFPDKGFNTVLFSKV